MSESSDKIANAVERIVAEAERLGGPVPYSDVLRLGERCGVTLDQIPELCRALGEADIEIEGAPATQFASSEGNGGDPGPSERDLAKLEREVTGRGRRKPLLTTEQEQDLARRIRAGEDAERRLQAGEEDGGGTLGALVRDGQRARSTMVERNQGLVRSVAETFKVAQSKLSFADLVSEGQIGLLRAISKFDHMRGFKFSTYATWWIFQSISRALADKGSLIRIPVHMHEHLRKFRKIRRSLERAEGREPSPIELAEHLGWPIARVNLLERLDRPSVSLDEPLNGQEGIALVDALPAPGVGPDEQMEAREVHQRVVEVVEELPEREHEILDRRFGLHDTPSETLAEIGQDLGVTRERVRQIEAKGLNRLRHPARSRRLWATTGEDGPCPEFTNKELSNPKHKSGSSDSDSGAGNRKVRCVAQQPPRRRRKRRRVR